MDFFSLQLSHDYAVNINLNSNKILRIRNDEDFKQSYAKLGSRLLSIKLLEAYKKKWGSLLHITTSSLATELYAHLFVDRILEKSLQFRLSPSIKNVLEILRQRTLIIDCGEAPLDQNRWIWDLLALLIRR